jgi:hypothetical protein
MSRSVIAIIVMLAAPILLLLTAAHTGFFSRGAVVAYFVLIAAWAIGVVVIWSARWSRQVTIGLTVVYTVAAIPVLPFASLLAVCSTGDCI